MRKRYRNELASDTATTMAILRFRLWLSNILIEMPPEAELSIDSMTFITYRAQFLDFIDECMRGRPSFEDAAIQFEQCRTLECLSFSDILASLGTDARLTRSNQRLLIEQTYASNYCGLIVLVVDFDQLTCKLTRVPHPAPDALHRRMAEFTLAGTDKRVAEHGIDLAADSNLSIFRWWNSIPELVALSVLRLEGWRDVPK